VCICAAKGTQGTVGKKVTGHDTGKKEKKNRQGGRKSKPEHEGQLHPKNRHTME